MRVEPEDEYTAPAQHVRIHGLTPFTEYEIAVKAWSSAGDSDFTKRTFKTKRGEVVVEVGGDEAGVGADEAGAGADEAGADEAGAGADEAGAGEAGADADEAGADADEAGAGVTFKQRLCSQKREVNS